MHIKEQMSLVKNSFVLIEVIFSFLIVAILVSSFSHFLDDKYDITIYKQLQKAQNEFVITGKVVGNYKGFRLKNQ